MRGKMSRRQRRWTLGLGISAVLIVVLILAWDWFKPLVEARASATIGRKVTMAHLHVHLGRGTKLVANNVEIANPDGFPAPTPYVRVAAFGATVDVLDYVLHQQIVIPLIDVNHPSMEAIALPSGQDNYSLQLASPGGATSSSASQQLGKLTIEGGQAHVVLPKLQADFHLSGETKAAAGIVAQHGRSQKIAVDAHST